MRFSKLRGWPAQRSRIVPEIQAVKATEPEAPPEELRSSVPEHLRCAPRLFEEDMLHKM
jgi:hypothetical protein